MRFVVIYLVLAIIIYVRGICPVIHDRRKRLWCLLAVLPEFGLRVFQRPSGRDVRSLS